MTNLRQAAGSLLVVGLSGTELTGLERAWLKTVQPAGVILFRRNIGSADQTRHLLSQATSLCAGHAFRCVDVEGGSVDRLRDALAPLPSVQAVAAAARKRGEPAPAQRHGELIARGVRVFGFNTTLAPVLDLALPASAGVMGSRCAGATAEEVTSYARAFLAGLAAHGVAASGKHFPGLGGGTLDSHLETPRIERTWDELWREDLAPYRALKHLLPMVMVSHAAYPQTPGGDAPASISHFWISEVLHKRIGYRGLIFSDDMEMGGILKHMPMEDAAIAAIAAGMSTLEICHSPELILRAYEALLGEAEKSPEFRRLLHNRARHAARHREKMLAREAAEAPSPDRLQTLRDDILQFREQIESGAVKPGAIGQSERPLVETA